MITEASLSRDVRKQFFFLLLMTGIMPDGIRHQEKERNCFQGHLLFHFLLNENEIERDLMTVDFKEVSLGTNRRSLSFHFQ